jgi:hypothetical protein
VDSSSASGKITASRVKRVVNGTPRGWASFAAELMHEQSREYVHRELHVPSIENGKIYEPVAIANAQIILGEEFEPVGFQPHPEFDWIGCSSDFLARDRVYNGEVKCPTTLEKHMAIRNTGQIPTEWWPQVQLQMVCHDVFTTLFISYWSDKSKYMPPEMRTAIVEVKRDNRYCDEMMNRCHEFRRYMLGSANVVTRGYNPDSLPNLF